MRLLSSTAQERIVVVSGRLFHENRCRRVGAHWFQVRAHADSIYTLKRTDDIAEMSHHALGLCFANAAAASANSDVGRRSVCTPFAFGAHSTEPSRMQPQIHCSCCDAIGRQRACVFAS